MHADALLVHTGARQHVPGIYDTRQHAFHVVRLWHMLARTSMCQEFMMCASKCHKFLAHVGAHQHAPQVRYMKCMLARFINSWRVPACVTNDLHHKRATFCPYPYPLKDEKLKILKIGPLFSKNFSNPSPNHNPNPNPDPDPTPVL